MDIDKRLEALLADSKDLKKRLSIVEGFIQHDADAIEIETAQAVQKHLMTSSTYQGFKLYIPTGFPAKLYDSVEQVALTDLDGVFVLTNNPDVNELNNDLGGYISLDDEVKKQLKERRDLMKSMSKSLSSTSSSMSNTPIRNIFVIIEAKHHVTKEKIEKKLVQLEKIESWLDDARSTIQEPYPKAFLPRFVKNVKMFGFDKYDPLPMFFIGGPCWDGDALKLMKSKMSEPRYANRLGMIQTS